MFIYTRAVLDDALKDIKKIIFNLSIAIGVFAIFLPLYKIITNTGLLIANIVLLISASGAFGFSFYIDKSEIDNKKAIKKKVKAINKWIIRIVKFAVIIFSSYELLTSKYDVIALIILLVTIFLWVMEILLDAVAKVIEKRVNFIITAFNADVAPAVKILNALNKLKGDELIEWDISKEDMRRLDKLAETFKEEKKAEKLEEEAKRRFRRRRYRKEFIEKIKAKLFFKKNNKKDKRA